MANGNGKKVDAVFEGGGVKGIALVGAVQVTEEQGYQFENVAGTSAGAIVASLIAAGYSAKELKEIMDKLNYNDFKDKGWVDKIPLIGEALSLGFENGIYEGEFLENWLRDLLKARGIETFQDLIIAEYQDNPKYRYKLQVIATDISRGRMLVLPQDIEDYGINPDTLAVAHAVRMSMSIPLFFEPVILKTASGETSYIVDGGVLSNYPVWIFDDETDEPAWPTLGYKLVAPDDVEQKPRQIKGPISLLAAMISTMMEAHDAKYIKDSAFIRTIPIPTLGVETTDFNLSRERSEQLYQSGIEAATNFFNYWDFDKYKTSQRKAIPSGRRQQVWGQPVQVQPAASTGGLTLPK
ncbi:MAG: patatin-like phospholipase family protein [Acidobacteriota bacterium]